MLTRADRLAAVAALTIDGYAASKIASILGCSQRQVTRDRGIMHVNKKKHAAITQEEIQKAHLFLQDGMSYEHTARTLGHSSKCIARHCPGYHKFTKAEASSIGVLINTLRMIKVKPYRKSPVESKIDK